MYLQSALQCGVGSLLLLAEGMMGAPVGGTRCYRRLGPALGLGSGSDAALSASTWHAGAQGHNGDGCDAVAQLNAAAKVGGQVANDGGQHADQEYRHKETRVAAAHLCEDQDTPVRG